MACRAWGFPIAFSVPLRARAGAMEFTGEYRIPADRETVWSALNDPDMLKACIPGCEELEKRSHTEFTARVATFNSGARTTSMLPDVRRLMERHGAPSASRVWKHELSSCWPLTCATALSTVMSK